jgi:hypothetical protein
LSEDGSEAYEGGFKFDIQFLYNIDHGGDYVSDNNDLTMAVETMATLNSSWGDNALVYTGCAAGVVDGTNTRQRRKYVWIAPRMGVISSSSYTESGSGESAGGGKDIDPLFWVKAEPPLVHGYQGLKNKTGTNGGPNRQAAPSRRRLTEALERLVQLYDAWGKPDEAAKWRQELEAVQKQ